MKMMRFFIVIAAFGLLSACGGDAKKEVQHEEGFEKEVPKSEKVEAFEALNGLLKADINNPNLYLKRAKLYMRYGDLISAVNDVDRAIGIDSTAAVYYLLKAELLKKQDKLKEAKGVLDQCMYADKDNLQARIELGWLALIGRRYKQALEDADAVLRRDV